ncbi:unnamed protein product, partial [Brachionus calyciflorus]
MSRLRPPSTTGNTRSQFLSSQNPLSQKGSTSSNPIPINKIIKQADIPSSLIPPNKPQRDVKLSQPTSSKNFNQSF